MIRLGTALKSQEDPTIVVSSSRCEIVLLLVGGDELVKAEFGAYSTLLNRISLPMNCANSFGLISPRPLNRVISGLPPSSLTALPRSVSL